MIRGVDFMEKHEVDFENAVVFDKVDINSSVDWDKEHIRDLGKIEQAVESINFAFDHGARCVVIASHQGDAGRNESLKLHAEALQKLLPEHHVVFAGARSGDKVCELVENANAGDVIVLENTRTESEEWDHAHPKETRLYKTFTSIDNLAAIKDDPASHRKELSSYGLLKQLAEDGKFVTIGPNFIREAKKAENAEKIREVGEELYGRLGTFADHLGKMGKSLNSSVQHFNKAASSFDTRVIPSVRKFSEMGISAKKDVESLEQIEHTSRDVEARSEES